MTSNPYQVGTTSEETKTRATTWIVRAGIVTLVIGGLFLMITVVGVVWSFQGVANSSAASDSTNLASGISFAVIPAFVGMPLAVIGIVLIILGCVQRQPVTTKSG